MSPFTTLVQPVLQRSEAVPGAPKITGAILLGDFFNVWLLGCLTVQCYLYYLDYRHSDRRFLHYLVFFVLIFEIVQSGVVLRDAFILFCLGWGDPKVLIDARLSWLAIPIMGSLMSCIVQVFYAWRIWAFSHRLAIPIIVCVLSLAQCGGGMGTGVTHVIHDLKVTELSRTFKSTIVWLAGTALCDIIIASSMVYYLLESRSGVKKTDSLLHKIIALTLETGLLCTVLAIIDLGLFLGIKNANFHLTPAIILSKLYSNCLMVVLNSRKRLRPASSGAAAVTFPSSSAARTPTTGSIAVFARPQTTNQTTDIKLNVSAEAEAALDGGTSRDIIAMDAIPGSQYDSKPTPC